MADTEVLNPKADFALVHEVLAGRRIVPLSGGASKILFFMLRSDTGCDTEIDAGGFYTRFHGRKYRDSDYTILAPSVVSQLMAWARIKSATGSLTSVLPPHHMPALPDWPAAWAFGPMRIWLVPDPDCVKIFVRPPTAGDGLLDGPPPLPAPIPPKRLVATFTEAVSCKHCRHPSLQFRRVDEALVCGECGSSFRPPLDVLRAARTEVID